MKIGHNSSESEYNKADELVTMREALMMDIVELKRNLEETKTLLNVADQSLHASLYREGELKKELNKLREAYNDLIGSDRPPLVKKAEIL